MFARICLDSDRDISQEVLQRDDVGLDDECLLASGMLYLCYHPSRMPDFS